MAKLKYLKYPKKPKTSASLDTKQKFIARKNAIDVENRRRKKVNDESLKLDKVIAGIGSASSIFTSASGFTSRIVRSRKKPTAKKAAKKKTVRRKKR